MSKLHTTCIAILNAGYAPAPERITTELFERIADTLNDLMMPVALWHPENREALLQRIGMNLYRSGIFDYITPIGLRNIIKYKHDIKDAYLDFIFQENEAFTAVKVKEERALPVDITSKTIERICKALYSDWDDNYKERVIRRNEVLRLYTIFVDVIRADKAVLVNHKSGRLLFGKYSGRTFSWVAQNDPNYIIWLYEKCAVDIPTKWVKKSYESLR